MAQNKRRSRKKGLSEDDKVKYIRLAAIPLIIIAVLIAVIVLMDRKPGAQKTEDTTAGYASESGGTEVTAEENSGRGDGAPEDSIAPDNNEYTTDFSSYELQKDEIPQVNQLISEYFQAKVDKDAKALYALFGKTDEDSLAERTAELENEAVFIEDYQDITCYTKPGLTDGSYVVYVTYEVKFRRVDTLAPGLMWCYVAKNDDGNYIIRENVVGEEADYVAAQNQTEDVRLLSAQINEKLKAAIESDSLLAGRYKELVNGAVASETEEESGQDSQVELIEEGAGASQKETETLEIRENAHQTESAASGENAGSDAGDTSITIE